MPKPCKHCTSYAHSSFQCFSRPRKALAIKTTLVARKPLKKAGKRYDEYERWKVQVARPYLDKTFGRHCANCGRMPPKNMTTGEYYYHDVDHIIKRSVRPDLVMVLSNVQYLCRPCHKEKDSPIAT